jgi:hypothetical protein
MGDPNVTEQNDRHADDTACVPSHPIPAEELVRYTVDRDPHSEQDIARYVELEASDEVVQHVEKVRTEVVLGDTYDIWDVTTDKGRWWVITNLTNLYSQRHFPSLDYTLSFHIGLMMRLRSRSNRLDADAPTPFDEVFRRQEQAEHRHDTAVEAEDYQAVGMQLRECLISLAAALRRRVALGSGVVQPKDADFVGWSAVLMDALCPGATNKELRTHLKTVAKETWQLVNWLTHARNASETAASIATHACSTVVGHFIQVLEREKRDQVEQCPICKSRDVRTHFDVAIEPDGDYYLSCGVCDWTNHPKPG